MESTARHYAQLIRKERLARKKEQARDLEGHENKEPYYELVDVNSVVTNDARTIGAEHVALSQMDEYGFKGILQELNFTEAQITYAYMLIIGRMVHPGSERETVRWLQETALLSKYRFKISVPFKHQEHNGILKHFFTFTVTL